MAKFSFIGDTHGDNAAFLRQLEAGLQNHSHTIHVGDVGVGMPGVEDLNTNAAYLRMLSNAKTRGLTAGFIRGNHDNPDVCEATQGYLGNSNFFVIDNIKVLLISGAKSIDADGRVPGMNWWDREQLSYQELYHLFQIYNLYRPDIVVTHCAPSCFVQAMGIKNIDLSPTICLFDQMINLYQPTMWVCGHYHNSETYRHGRTTFRCVNIGERYEVAL